MPNLLYRELPESEHDRLLPIYEAMSEAPLPGMTTRYVAEFNDEIVGCVSGEKVVLVGGHWVRKDFRGQFIAERLANEGYPLLPPWRKLMITRNRHVELLAHEMGFVPQAGQLWVRRVS